MADVRFYPAARVVPFQGKTGSGIGFAAVPGRGLGGDDGCALGGPGWLEHLRKNSPVTASEEFVEWVI